MAFGKFQILGSDLIGVISPGIFTQIHFHSAGSVFNRSVQNNVEKTRVDALTHIKIARFNSLHIKMCGL
ncbi:MAG: hypothetical protein DMG65_07685 [Candidatus Angelobacter sp. Gp1-AA117]|nr:MAG: hypothetical protein DMG65_07685 [Candidatus Angelobacter sp. Gp1-AA117]